MNSAVGKSIRYFGFFKSVASNSWQLDATHHDGSYCTVAYHAKMKDCVADCEARNIGLAKAMGTYKG